MTVSARGCSVRCDYCHQPASHAVTGRGWQAHACYLHLWDAIDAAPNKALVSRIP